MFPRVAVGQVCGSDECPWHSSLHGPFRRRRSHHLRAEHCDETGQARGGALTMGRARTREAEGTPGDGESSRRRPAHPSVVFTLFLGVVAPHPGATPSDTPNLLG